MTDQANTGGMTASIRRRFVALIAEVEAIHGEVHEEPSVGRVIGWNAGARCGSGHRRHGDGGRQLGARHIQPREGFRSCASGS